MYQTYKNEEIKKPVTEKLIPREIINEKPKAAQKQIKKEPAGIFGGLENEEIIILGLLLVLYFEDCRDNMLMIILVALLFIKD